MKKRWYRPRNVLIAVAVVALAWTGRYIYTAVTAVPGPPFDRAAAATALTLKHQEGLKPGLGDAWESLDRAIAVLGGIEQQVRSRLPDDQVPADYAALADPGTLEYIPREQHYPVLSRSRLIVQRFETEGGEAAMLDLPRTERAIRTIGPATDRQHNDRRGGLRQLARLCVGRMAVAASEQDGEAYVRAFEQGLALGRILMQQADRVDQMTGSSVAHMMLGHARRTLMSPDRLLRGHHGALLAAAERQHALIPSASFVVETQRIEFWDWIQQTYTDNGRGNGRAIVSFAVAWGAPPPVSGRIGTWLMKQVAGYQIANVFGVVYPDKAAARRKVDEYSDRLLKLAEERRWSRRGSMDSFEAWSDAISPKHFLLYKDKSRHTWFSHSTILDQHEALEAHFAGVRTLIAVELHISRTMTLPETLADLIPATLPELPLDPYTGEPMQFRAQPQWPWYVLYSVGWDGEDNGATQHPKGLDATTRSQSPGYDFVFNVPPPEPERSR